MFMIGKNLAHYEVLDLVGKGGMGEVYRARDSKLGREVALKVLPRELSGDPERTARFEREARALASLQHPNVAAIFGFEDTGTSRFLVMELVQGETLASRIARGGLSIDEVTHITRQIAAGLEAAHDRGIVHRDLKPANLMLTPDGEVKILDFGLARAWFGDGTGEQDIGASPTITAAMTQAGTILGTAAYMSPEQARGRNVDRRADIWAFGVILWEMLTGVQLFEGETISDTLAAVLRAEPDWSELPSDEAPLLCRVVERCLIRDPRQRLRDIGEVRILLQDGGSQSSLISSSMMMAGQETIAPVAERRAHVPLLALVGLLGVVVGGIVGARFLTSQPESAVLHAMIPPPRGAEFQLSGNAPGPAVLSPDGTMVAFTARDPQGVTRVFLRHLDREDAVALSGTEEAAYPFWSPDSRSIGFFTVSTNASNQRLKKIAVSGGPPVSLCVAANGKGGTWAEDGTILFAPSHDSAIFRVPSIGGEPVAVTEFAEGEDSHRHPRFLPGGREFLYLSRRTESDALHTIWLAPLEGGEPRRITESSCQAEYAAGHLLTAADGVLFATPFDRARGAITGGRTPLVESILIISSGAAVGSYSVSRTGMMTYQTGSSLTARVLEWNEIGSDASSSVGVAGQMHYPKISPDGTHCVVEVRGESQTGVDLWLVDLGTGLRTRFTFDPGDEFGAVWAPDSQSIFYTSRVEGGTHRIIEQPVEGMGGSAILLESPTALRTTSVHPDRTALLFERVGADTAVDIAWLPLTGEGEPRDVLVTPAAEGGGQLSPDGRWIAYHTESSSTWDIFVMSSAGGPRKWQITTQGAVYPQWNAEGTRLYVSTFGQDILAYEVDTRGESLRVGGFTRAAISEPPNSLGVAYSLHPDGKRIVRSTLDAGGRGEVSLLHLVTDWRRGLGQ
jgi:eukaryotic-like serine/threonine-protein kinase